jgi:hypothetical protein
MGRNLTLEIENDEDMVCPSHNDGAWKLYPFNTGLVDYRDPSEFRDDEEFLAKLKVGLAFVLDCYDHSGRTWSLHKEGRQCEWDTASGGGVLVWEEDEENMGAKTLEDRAEDARAFLKEYNAWANGNVYLFTLEGPDLHETICGFYDEDEMMKQIADLLEPGDTVTVEGEGAWLLQYHPIKKDGVTITTEPQED